MAHTGVWPRRLLRVWQECEGAYVEVATETHGPREFELPSWPWRWVCWFQGHQWYGQPRNDYCVICRKIRGSA